MLFEIDNISKSLGEKLLIKNFTLRILQQDTIAIVGKNGAGKSTLLRLLLNDMEPDEGKIKSGEFSVGYFDQQRVMLDNDKNIIDTFCPNGGDRVDVRGRNMHVYGYLKNFLFPKEYLDKKLGLLSGGEKNRVALALLFTKQYDCIIMDEPTNDLDINTINILEEYLQSFEGALIFVSHDRYFVDKIAKKLLIFRGEGLVEESYQSYSEYLEIEKELKELDSFAVEFEKPKEEEKRVTNRALKLSYKEKSDYESLPLKIEKLEQEIEKTNNCLANPECYQEKGLTELGKQLETLESEYEEVVERFLEIEEKIEEISKG
jgi:ATP-binding cassette subfamily F protein uup